ncbi:hypothetical protein [Bacillus wiedmannii]|uniref:hypothetical protein n=1 Tax=Bacillus wiedmannii TaxID=1890302 RepID=UPI002E1AA695|nr:hypothetical protein [Bacillus wiedmannii]
MPVIKNEELSKSKVIQKRKFPNRENYEQYFGDSNIWSQEQMVKLVHKHWHGRGQNGCLFAQHLAKESNDKTGWHSSVILEGMNTVSKLDDTIERAIKNPDIEVLSLLFPNVVTIEQLSTILKEWIRESKLIFLESATKYENRICLSLRIDLEDSGVISWLMMFAPFTFFPNTRQAPIMELAIRVKPKSEDVYSKSNQDKEKAHLADTPFYIPDKVVDSTWEATFRNTQYILEGKPDFVSAAKTTISFEKEVWEQYFNDLEINIQESMIKEEQYS